MSHDQKHNLRLDDHTDLLKPTAVLRETFPVGCTMANNAAAFTSGKPTVSAIVLQAGDVISNIIWYTGSAGSVGPTHTWFAIADKNRVMVACTADNTSGAIAGGSIITLPIATIASGASATYTVPTTDYYYLVAMFAASTSVPTAMSQVSALFLLNQTPLRCAQTADSGLTAAPAFPTTFGALTSLGAWVYATVS